MRDFLGTGWAFPVGVDAHGRIILARQERDIEEAMRIILLTPKGQRVMRPEFGCQIHDLIFAPNDATTCGLTAYYVEEALGMWEPRIRVQEVEARPDPDDPGRLLVEIRYEIKATHDSRSLVFPFYRIPGEAENDGVAHARDYRAAQAEDDKVPLAGALGQGGIRSQKER